ncbi:hypothetical protein ACI3LZ_005467 [Candidozyma auris]|nr:hypothetical protein QG37_07535 [[Candida] auris]
MNLVPMAFTVFATVWSQMSPCENAASPDATLPKGEIRRYGVPAPAFDWRKGASRNSAYLPREAKTKSKKKRE